MHEFDNDGQFREFTDFIDQLHFIFVFMLHLHLSIAPNVTVFLFVTINDVDNDCFLNFWSDAKIFWEVILLTIYFCANSSQNLIMKKISIFETQCYSLGALEEEYFNIRQRRFSHIFLRQIYTKQAWIVLAKQNVLQNMTQNLGPRKYF